MVMGSNPNYLLKSFLLYLALYQFAKYRNFLESHSYPIDKIKLILYPRVRNSITRLAIVNMFHFYCLFKIQFYKKFTPEIESLLKTPLRQLNCWKSLIFVMLSHWRVRDHPFKTSTCLRGEGCPHGPMVERSQYIRIKNPLHKHFAGMPMVGG